MGLFGALTASVSGLSGQGEAISVISDNLSNTNTIGFKSSRALFAQLVTSSGVGGTQFNAGGVDSIVQRGQDTQGSLISSTKTTDLALSGNGFFRVSDTQEIDTDTSFFFTRAGSFSEDKEGFLVAPSGHYLQGWRTDSDGTIQNLQTPESVELQSVGVSAQASTSIELGINLTSTTSINSVYDTTAALTGSAGNNLESIVTTPAGADFLSDVRVFDAQGGARDVTIGFTKRAANFWDWTMFTDGSNIEGGTTGTNTRIGNGTLRFNQDGSLLNATGTSLTADWSGGVADGSLTMDFGEFSGGQIVTAETTFGFDDHVLDVGIESTALTNGTYDLIFNADSSLQLVDSGANVLETVTGIADTSTTREVLFSTSGVRITLGPNFDVTPGAYPNTVGDITIGTQAASGDGSGTDGVIQFAASFNTSFVNQDGFGSGTLSAINVDEEGFISGTFTNGETKKLFKLNIAVFQNAAGLEPVSGSLYRVTDFSGQPLLKEAGVGGTATVISGALEGSTVDIANEFSQMIVAQRGFQASSTVISTVDQMLNELLQLR
jgi:flagellar hook protein FlgE